MLVITFTITINIVIPAQLLFKKSDAEKIIPGSIEELEVFKHLQVKFADQFELFFPDNLALKTIIVIPSLTLDQDVLAKVEGSLYYEERLLCLLMLLRMPRTHVTYVSSMPIDPVIIDYYLHLLPGISGYHAQKRLTLLSCYDARAQSLTEKILQRPRLIEKIRQSIKSGHVAHIACFNTTPLERTLSVQLNAPIYGCDPSLIHFGTKSGSRNIFKKAGVSFPPGIENLRTFDDLVKAIVSLKEQFPDQRKVVIKLNDGFSGDGNALFTYPKHILKEDLFNWLNEHLRKMIMPVAEGLSIDVFLLKLNSMGGIVESFIEGETKSSPSVQCRINPRGDVDIISTHDQVLGGQSGQVFIGAHFPADVEYRSEISEIAYVISQQLKTAGVLGRFSIDFISVKNNTKWKHYAIEINLRKGGTTHPYLMMQFLTNGHYNKTTGMFETANNQFRYYFASDNIQHECYKGLSAQDLIEIVMFHGLHFDGASQKGVIFHMIGALSQYGKMGMMCIGESSSEAFYLYQKTIEVLNAECGIA